MLGGTGPGFVQKAKALCTCIVLDQQAMLAIQLFGYLVAILALGTAVRGELDLLQLGRSSKDPLVGGHKVKQTRVDPLQLVSVEEVLGELQQLKISHVSS